MDLIKLIKVGDYTGFVQHLHRHPAQKRARGFPRNQTVFKPSYCSEHDTLFLSLLEKHCLCTYHGESFSQKNNLNLQLLTKVYNCFEQVYFCNL